MLKKTKSIVAMLLAVALVLTIFSPDSVRAQDIGRGTVSIECNRTQGELNKLRSELGDLVETRNKSRKAGRDTEELDALIDKKVGEINDMIWHRERLQCSDVGIVDECRWWESCYWFARTDDTGPRIGPFGLGSIIGWAVGQLADFGIQLDEQAPAESAEDQVVEGTYEATPEPQPPLDPKPEPQPPLDPKPEPPDPMPPDPEPLVPANAKDDSADTLEGESPTVEDTPAREQYNSEETISAEF